MKEVIFWSCSFLRSIPRFNPFLVRLIRVQKSTEKLTALARIRVGKNFWKSVLFVKTVRKIKPDKKDTLFYKIFKGFWNFLVHYIWDWAVECNLGDLATKYPSREDVTIFFRNLQKFSLLLIRFKNLYQNNFYPYKIYKKFHSEWSWF